MRVVIAGSRGIDEGTAWDLLLVAMDEVIDACGAVQLVLACGESSVGEAGLRWAREHGVPAESHTVIPPGRTAPVRNDQVLARGEILVLIWDADDASAALLRRQAEARGLIIAEMVLPSRGPARRAPSGRTRGREARP